MSTNRINLKKTKTLLLLLTFSIILSVWALSRSWPPSIVYYENQVGNFSLEYPGNWELNESERVYVFTLKARKGLFRRHSALITLFPGIEFPEDPQVDLETVMVNYIEAFTKQTHKIKSLQVIQISDIVDTGSHQMIWATVAVPTLDIAEGSPVNQMGERRENVMQIIDIYILRNNRGKEIAVEVYKGADEDLNAQAEEIVRSIRFINE